MTVHAFALACFTILSQETRIVILMNQIVKVVIRPEDDVTAATAVPPLGPPFGDKRLAVKSHSPFSAMARSRIDFYLVDEHTLKKKKARSKDLAAPKLN
jgi:hypothetical protein